MVVSDHKSTSSRSSIAGYSNSDAGSVLSIPETTSSPSSNSNSNSSSSSTNIKVIARFRPFNNDELALDGGESAATPIVEFLSEESCNIETRDFNGSFTFDRVFDMQSQQEDVFNYSFRQTVDDLMNGYNGTVFAYGQTGSGKSYTMMGPNNSIDDPASRGMIPRIVDHIFEMILNSSADIEYTVKVSYMEIYMERIRDLLNPKNNNLPIHEEKARGVYVKGLTEEYVSSSDEVYDVMRQGANFRAVASTNMNQESSRSHSIFVITLAQKNTVTGAQKVGQLSLVDLAGSEKVGKTGASGQTLEEAKKINKSLSALGMVINSLTDGKSSHIPYRDSKLTRILQESLGGNSRTSLIVNCSPSSFNDSETLSSLRFGVRAKNIKNKAKINTELSPLELRQLLRKCQTQLESRIVYSGKLEVEISAWRSGDPPAKDTWIPLGGPSTSSLSSVVDSVRKPGGHSVSASSAFPPSSSTGHRRRHSSIISAKSPSASLRKNSVIPNTNTSSPLKRSSLAEPFTPSSTVPNSGASTPGLTPSLGPDSEVSFLSPDSPSRSSKRNSSGGEVVDTIEEYLRRENELSDQISEKESIINEQEQLLLSLRAQLSTATQQNQQQLEQHQTQKKASGELSKLNTELKLQVDNLHYEKKELSITADTLNDENKKLTQELQDVKRKLLEYEMNDRTTTGSSSGSTKEDEENADENSVSLGSDAFASGENKNTTNSEDNDADSDTIKVSKVRSSAAKSVDGEDIDEENLTTQALHEMKKQQKLTEMLGEFYQPSNTTTTTTTGTSNRNFSRNVSRAVSLADFIDKSESNKESPIDYLDSLLENQNKSFQEFIKNSQESDNTKEELKQAYEAKLKASEETTRQLVLEISRLKGEAPPSRTNILSAASADAEAKTQPETEAELETEGEAQHNKETGSGEVVPVSVMKEKEEQIETMQGHIAQYESLKASLMQDLQERCERVVELEISLDQAREQYNLAINNSNNKQQNKKMTLLQRNLDQLTTIQRQLVEQNVVLKRDVAMAHKILDARNDRIQSLESALRDSQNRLNQESEVFETKLTYLRDRLLEVKRGGSSGTAHNNLSTGSSSSYNNNNAYTSSSSLYQLRDRQNLNPYSLGPLPSFTSPPGSPTNSSYSGASFPTVASYGPNNKVVHYPDLSSNTTTGRNTARNVSGGANSKIVKPLRGGGQGAGSSSSSTANDTSSHLSGIQTPIRQKATELTRSATGLWTKLNSLVANSGGIGGIGSLGSSLGGGGSNPGSPTRSPNRSPTRPISPIRLYRGSETKNDATTATGAGEDENDGDSENKDKAKGDEESTFIAGIPPSLSYSTSYSTSIDT